MGYLVRVPGLVWADLVRLLIKEYTNEGIAVEAMRSLKKLAQTKDETSLLYRQCIARVISPGHC